MSDKTPETTSGGEIPFETANDRFKRSFGSWFWGSITAAVFMHAAVMFFFPNLSAEDYSFEREELEIIDIPPEVEVPPPPEQIQRPATPVVTDAVIDDDITIQETTFEQNQPEDLPPPREAGEGDLSENPQFTPRDVEPRLLNGAEVGRALERAYPQALQDAGIGGEVIMHFFVNEQGQVENYLVNQSSGRAALDQAAMSIANTFEFAPAQNRDQPVPVWISIPIRFSPN